MNVLVSMCFPRRPGGRRHASGLILGMQAVLRRTNAVSDTGQLHEVDVAMTMMVYHSHGGPAHQVAMAALISIAKRIEGGMA